MARSGRQQASVADGATISFSNPQARFSVAIPDDWQQDTAAASPGLIIQFHTTNPDGAFSVTTAPLPTGMAIEAVSRAVRARLAQTYPDYRETGSAPTVFAGQAGIALGYTATAADGQLLAMSQIIVPRDGTLYLLTRAAKPENLGAMERAAAPILASWRWRA